MARLSFLALCFNLALLASAAPVKREEANDQSPDIAAKVAYGSLKSATQMMKDMNDMYHEDYGTKMPMSNEDAAFPSADGEDAEGMEEMETPSADEKQGEEEEKGEAVEQEGMDKEAAQKGAEKEEPSRTETEEKRPSPSKSSKPSAAASPSHVVQDDPLKNLPLVGGLLSGGGLL